MTIEIDPNEQYVFDKSTHHGGALLTYLSYDVVNVIMAVLKRHEEELNRDLEKFGLRFDQLGHPDWPRLVSAQEVLDAATAVLNKNAPHAVVNIFTDVDPEATAREINRQLRRKAEAEVRVVRDPAGDPGPFVAAGGWCAPGDSPFTRPRPTSMWRQIGGVVYVNLPDRGNVDQWVKASAIVAIGTVAAKDSAIQARVQVSGSPTMWTTLTPDEIAARVTEAMDSAESLL